jgi:hypothetical protein
MAKKVKQITFDSIVRLVIFAVLIYLSIIFINSSMAGKTPVISKPADLPPIVSSIVDSIASSSAFKDLSKKYSPKIEEIKKLPQKEYEKFKNQIIDELLKRLDSALRSK